ncbi:MAG: hypothetical protein LCH71_05195 [Proteobacteria bacterium]|nr:hypothetical protein [Pseudomonadota bacterium]
MTTISGDIAIGVALASACTWLIQAAALGLFLSFVAWLLTFVLSLAMSQYVLHPVVQVVLSDRKLDHAARTVRALAGGMQQHLSAFAGAGGFSPFRAWRKA